jgi:hypothetical protein
LPLSFSTNETIGDCCEGGKLVLRRPTMLAKNNSGKFPQAHVSSVLRSGSTIAARGSSEMPIWGPLLQSMSKQDDALAAERIVNLTHYLETLQAK